MILKLYSIRDLKTNLYHPPAYCHNAGHAMRHFTTIHDTEDSPIHKFPEDYQLFEVGEFDDFDGKLTPYDPHLVCSFTELLNMEPKHM